MKIFTILAIQLITLTILTTACTGVSQENYGKALADYQSLQTQYIQVKNENTGLQTQLTQVQQNATTLQTQLTQVQQIVTTLQTQLIKAQQDATASGTQLSQLKKLTTDIEVYSGTLTKGRVVLVPINYFEKIEGKVIGNGFRAYLKESGGKVVLDLGTTNEREFSFTSPNTGAPPFFEYYIDYDIPGEIGTQVQCTTAYVLFYTPNY